MRLQLAALVVILVPLAVAAEEAWPSKGDTVHVSASFKKLSAASPVAGAQMQYDMPPCAALVITKTNPKKPLWITKDPVGGTQHLEGGWLARMHRTKAECEAQYSQDGEPNVTHSGNTFKLVPGNPK
jgi:hypothetical protein